MELTEKKGERERERDGRMRRGKGQGKSKWQWQGKHARKEEEEDKRKVYCYGAISYVGVIWFFFMFTNFYQLDLHNKTKPVLHSQIYDETFAKNGLEIGPPML